jgi:transposase InsO family protein
MIKEEHMKRKKCYGSPRIFKALKAKDVQVSRPRVARLMKQANIRAKMVRRFRVTTDSKHSFAVSENLLNRNFSAKATGQAWVSDITYIRTLPVRQSMSRKANCWDNAVAESFFKTLKTECVNGNRYQDQEAILR